jgi:hypothetical protein
LPVFFVENRALTSTTAHAVLRDLNRLPDAGCADDGEQMKLQDSSNWVDEHKGTDDAPGAFADVNA